MAQAKSEPKAKRVQKAAAKTSKVILGIFTGPPADPQGTVADNSPASIETAAPVAEQVAAANTVNALPANLVAEINHSLVRLYAFHLNYGSRTVAYSNLRRDITRIATENLTEAEFLHGLFTVPFGEGDDAPLCRVTAMIGDADRTMRRNGASPEDVVGRLRAFHASLAAACEAGNIEDILLTL